MAGRPLTAIVAPRPDAARTVHERWDRGEAVAVLDPATPAAALGRLLRTLAPTHIVDHDGERALPGGIPVADDIAAVVVTSGTTGTPKCVELTTAGAEAIGEGFARALGSPDDDWALVCLPLHHVAGLAILARARANDVPVMVHPGFDVDAVGAAPAQGATIVSLVPTMLARLLAADAPVDAFRVLVLGGAPLPDELRARAEARGARVADSYGLSETWGGVLVDGIPIDGADVRLANGDDDAAADEILVRGPMVMARYRHDDVATEAAFTADGWLRTGDVGVAESGRGVRVIDRLKDLVVSGGVNVSPTAVERVLAGAPGVHEVCVAGAPDREWGERVVAFVVPDDPSSPPDLDSLRAFARDELSRAQLPKELVLVDAIPRSPGGKLLRRELPPPA